MEKISVKLFRKINELDLAENHKDQLEKKFENLQPVIAGYAPGLIQLVTFYDYPEYGFGVPSGFVCDGASIPGFLQGKFTPWSVGGAFRPEYIKAVIAHDYLYRAQICGRKEADDIMLALLRESNVNRWESRKMHMAVRTFGGIPWAKNRKRKERAADLIK
jgi:hypothetical protein